MPTKRPQIPEKFQGYQMRYALRPNKEGLNVSVLEVMFLLPDGEIQSVDMKEAEFNAFVKQMEFEKMKKEMEAQR